MHSESLSFISKILMVLTHLQLMVFEEFSQAGLSKTTKSLQ